ncbi:hypothetical protein [Hymenobacter arizonensis]|uniref:YD repeat-containing protein n=1 Tax=Hymenobacter arizonensis TaxID=1227077 RepID=A0A1I6AEQ0_HYMAR|nr:hypothetical protein [Hymenobacter arizonensis]SFQ67120.1 hypothetical protein SAMN04515668_3603 [Hymenobacter arizonensis]
MNTKLLGLLVAATLATAACQQEKTVETTTTTEADTAVVTTDDVSARDDARRLASRVAEDLKLTDTAAVTRIERTYYTRSQTMRNLETRYASDTTGRYLAMREANDRADEEVRTTLNNPAYYNTYSANRANYGDGPYTLSTTTAAAPRATTGRNTSSIGQGSGIKKMEREADGDSKTKYRNGAKVKVDDDGSRKIKMADGTKIKIDEDGNRKVKRP